jgi:Cu+-exporting ATPase
MRVDPAHSAGTFTAEAATYHFCSTHCLERFKTNPSRFLHPAVRPEEMPAGLYTCPMHPEVSQEGFGYCPLCGMALDAASWRPGQAANPELAAMSRRFRWSLLFTVPVFALGMAMIEPRLQGILATPAVFWCGWPIFERAWQSVRRRSPNMFTLVAIGIAAAWLFSVGQVLIGGHHAHVYFEAAAVIVTLVLLGQVLELRAREKTTAAIRALLQLTPPTVRTEDGRDVPVSSVRPGDFLRVRPGERVPLDGSVIEGSSAVDESAITGESIPIEKQPGAKVIGGTVNGTGAFLMRVDRTGADTLLARIVELVSEAQRSRGPGQRAADRAAAWLVPAVLAVAGVTYLAWLPRDPTFAFVNAISVLIVACPCALGLATPMSITVGVGRGGRAGVLVQSAEALEALSKADTLVIDKTGTLTEGRPRVTAFRGDDAALRIAAALEQSSEHPLAAAILAFARERGATPETAHNLSYLPGLGVSATVDGRKAAIGSRRFMEQFGIVVPDGSAALYLAAEGEVIAKFEVSDPVKPGARASLDRIRADGLRVVMLTGDSRPAAEAVARAVGIERVQAEALPAAKHAFIERLIAEGHTVAMAGDGVNDAPALARAHVGIAMGNGTDIAIKSAGIILVKGDLEGIVRARRLSRAVIANIRQNLFWAFAYNLLGVPVAAGVLYPFLGILLSPMFAAAAMTFSSVSVIANALRLRSVEI